VDAACFVVGQRCGVALRRFGQFSIEASRKLSVAQFVEIVHHNHLALTALASATQQQQQLGHYISKLYDTRGVDSGAGDGAIASP